MPPESSPRTWTIETKRSRRDTWVLAALHCMFVRSGDLLVTSDKRFNFPILGNSYPSWDFHLEELGLVFFPVLRTFDYECVCFLGVNLRFRTKPTFLCTTVQRDRVQRHHASFALPSSDSGEHVRLSCGFGDSQGNSERAELRQGYEKLGSSVLQALPGCGKVSTLPR